MIIVLLFEYINVMLLVHGNLVVGPTAEDVTDRTCPKLNADTIKELQNYANRIIPALENFSVLTCYAGLRPATQFFDYCMYPLTSRLVLKHTQNTKLILVCVKLTLVFVKLTLVFVKLILIFVKLTLVFVKLILVFVKLILVFLEYSYFLNESYRYN